jgi:hypothetical protein
MKSLLARLSHRGSLALAVVALALVIPAAASAAPFTARLSAPNHQPKANKKWWITVTATHGSTKLNGSVDYSFLFDGQVVSRYPGHAFTHGHFRDWLLFPKRAIGHTITLQINVHTNYGTVKLPWWIKTKP